MKRMQFMKYLSGVIAGTALVPRVRGMGLDANTPAKAWPQPDAGDERFWKFVRDQFPLTHDRAYLNTGGLGASPYVVIDAVKAKMDELEKISETGHDETLWKQIKTDAGTLLGCDPDELGFTRNATEGINIVANGFPFREGDEIITSTHEHVGNAFTWLALQKRKGVVLKFFEPSTLSHQENVDRIAKLVTGRTRLVSIPHAVTTTGLIMPVKEIARLAQSEGIWFFVDGAQTAGMIPFSLHDIGCDAYATSGHKWLMGPKETGLLYVRKGMWDTLAAKFVGAYSDDGFDFLKGTFAFHPSARRYEYGTVSIPLRVGLHAAINFVQKIGIENVWKRDHALATRLFEGLRDTPEVKVLSPADDTMRSAMVTLMHDRLPYLKLQEHLNTYKLRTRSVTEGGLAALRISTHIYNSFEEVERVLEGVRSA
jgi:selenocysteine lyase/cysteine desulfurase